jgi:hypothetical protein
LGFAGTYLSSKIVNTGKWSDIPVIRMPLYVLISVKQLQKMLSINVADVLCTLVGFVISGNNEFVYKISRNEDVPE